MLSDRSRMDSQAKSREINGQSISLLRKRQRSWQNSLKQIVSHCLVVCLSARGLAGHTVSGYLHTPFNALCVHLSDSLPLIYFVLPS